MSESRRLRVGVAGAGLIGQVEHIPNLLSLRRRFELVAVADPSACTRAAIEERHGVTTVGTSDDLLGLDLDALVVALPDALHAETVLAALQRGLHVLCEKPLCYRQEEYGAIAAARDRADRVVQVGYMKRFDPSYESALALLPEGGAGLRYIGVEVQDPDAWPFVGHREFLRADDVPAGLIDETRRKQRSQAEATLGGPLRDDLLRGYTDPLMSGVVHCVNVVHGMLDRMGIADTAEVVGGSIFAGGAGASGSVALLGGGAHWHFAHVAVPRVALYRERYSLFFEDLALELEFPAPYLNHHPTGLWVRRSDGLRLETTQVRTSFDEPFVRELEAFWASAVEGAPVRNTVEDAARDARLLAAVAARALEAAVPA